MKELLIEEKAKRYDEAIKVAKSNYETIMQMDEDCTFTKEGIVNTFHHMFPELKESEDDNIKGAIVDYLKDCNLMEWATWLEKQGEQKPTEVVEPKFKVGDWIISDEAHEDYRICKIIEIGNGNYKIESIHGYKGYNEYKFFDSIYRLWTIEDAKPGDILTDKEGCTCIFRDLDTDFDGTMVTVYCGINVDGYFVISEEGEVWANPEDVYPADSDNRNNLFAKMKEAGYEWDSDKLTLRFHSEKVEPKFKVGDWIVCCDYEPVQIISIESEMYNLSNGDGRPIEMIDSNPNIHLWNIKDAKVGDVLVNQNGEMPFIFKECKDNHIYCYCGYTNIKDIFFDRFVDNKGKELHWLNLYHEQVYPATKEQRELLFAKMKEAGYEWDVEKKELKKIEQKPVDIEAIKAEYYEAGFEDGKKYCAGYENGQEYDGGKEYSQEPAAWSEEDELFVHGLIRGLAAKKDIHGHITFSSDCIDITETINWLKSLKDRVCQHQNTITDEELAHAKKDAYNEALDKIEYSDDDPTFFNGWDAAIWYLKKKGCTPKKNIEWIKAKQKIIDWTVDFLKYKGFEDEAEKLASLKQIF